uniref:Uncharacterized protein n=1 Tax=Arundo donax TaxID=35708 RepID=A0A0A9AVK7_ARUDO
MLPKKNLRYADWEEYRPDANGVHACTSATSGWRTMSSNRSHTWRYSVMA